MSECLLRKVDEDLNAILFQHCFNFSLLILFHLDLSHLLSWIQEGKFNLTGLQVHIAHWSAAEKLPGSLLEPVTSFFWDES